MVARTVVVSAATRREERVVTVVRVVADVREVESVVRVVVVARAVSAAREVVIVAREAVNAVREAESVADRVETETVAGRRVVSSARGVRSTRWVDDE